MSRAKNAALVLCLFILYCVLLSQGLKANALSTFFGALVAVPLTVHVYNRVWPGAVKRVPQRDCQQYGGRCRDVSPAESERAQDQVNSVERE